MPLTTGPETTGPPPGSLCRIRVEGRSVVGLVTDLGIVPTTVKSPLAGIIDGALDPRLQAQLSRVSDPVLDPDRIEFLPPVQPRVLLYCGRNYADHLAENPRPPSEAPVFFSKLPSSLIGHRVPIEIDPAQQADYEGELAVVIGRRSRGVAAGGAGRMVAGYTIVNDVSDRSVQRVNHQLTMAKGPDTFGPIGPYLVPRQLVGDGSALSLRTWVNDELRQNAITTSMIHDVAQCIAAATRTVTLQPGDVIATGTPAGVGAYHHPPRFLRPGDTVSVAIDRLGTLVNPVRSRPAR